MDIRKLDTDEYFEEKDQRRKDERVIRRSKMVPRDSPQAPGKKRIRVYLTVLGGLAIVSAINIYLNRSLFSFSYHDPELAGQELEAAFYRLCFDIEFFKHETGTYPESIDALKFSHHLTYSREKDVFRLAYGDGRTSLSYDSAGDSGSL